MNALLLDRLRTTPSTFLARFPSPCFVVDEGKLRENAAILDSVQRRTGAKILLALKGFAMWDVFPLLSRAPEGSHGPLHGCCASSPDEARLAREMFGGEVHAFAAGYSESDVLALVRDVDHLVFNSFAQWRRFRETVRTSPRGSAIACGLRVNPEHSEGAVPIYDPCSPGSRLGIRLSAFEEEERQGRLKEALEGVSGLHFHTLCEQGADALARTLEVFEKKFGRFLAGMRWVNFGGGHHITREGYDLDLLCACIARVRDRYGVQVYLEPGEAVALDAGILISTVLDVVNADRPVVILDTSAAAHMPDVLEMPYRPAVIGPEGPENAASSDGCGSDASGSNASGAAWTCRLAGKSCLAGDTIGEYAFARPLVPGDRLAFLDMAIYSMVKTTTFNGLRLPAIARYNPNTDEIRLVKQFGYDDFKNRLS